MPAYHPKPLLRSKTFMGIFAILLIMALLMFAAVRMFVFQSVSRMETSMMEQHLVRLQRALTLHIEKLDTITRDWAPWDDAAEFISSHNQEFIDSNMGSSTLINLNINLMAFLDTDGLMIYGEAVTLGTGQQIAIPEQIENSSLNHTLRCDHDLVCVHKGVVASSGGPLMLATRPITDSLQLASPVGTLVVGRFLDAATIADIEQLTHLKITASPYESPSDATFEAARHHLKTSSEPLIQLLTPHTISGYTVIRDLSNQPLMILRIDQERSIYALGRRNVQYFVLAFMLVVGISGLLIGFLVLRDLTLRHRNALAIEQLNQELEQRVTDRTRQLEAVNASLQQEIQERQQTETALRQSEEKYRNILDTIQEGYFELNLAGDFVFFNQALLNISGHAAHELRGMNNRLYTTPQTAQRMYQAFNTLYHTGKTVRISNYEIITKDGSRRIMEVSADLMRDDDGRPVGFRGLARDVTERIQAENQRLKLERHLQTAQKMEALGTMAGGIAHNFNNLMMGIQGMASLALLEIEAGHPSHKRLNSIGAMVENGARLTRELLNFARGGHHSVQPTHLNQLIDNTLELFGMTCPDVEIQRNFSADLPLVNLDRGQMEQVLLNLFVNAWHAMLAAPESPRHLTVSTHIAGDPGNTPVAGSDVSQTASGDRYVQFKVRDTGCGMDAKTKSRIFEPFFTTKTSEMGGTGLGLASVYGIIAGHQGHIEVDSAPGEGATFTIYLPVSEKDSLLPETATADRTLVYGQGTILLVDDDAVVRQVNGEMLEALGYQVIVADSGRQALGVYQQQHDLIQLVILDMIMPDMSGSDTFDGLKQIRPDVRVVLASGYSHDEQVTRMMEKGCMAFIQKPFRMEVLSQVLNDVMPELLS